MGRQFGKEYSERPLMSTLSDLLDIPHFTTARGSTVRMDFLFAVAEALQIDVPPTVKKDPLIRLIWETARGEQMPLDRLSAGGTVTNRVLEEVIDGIISHGPEASALEGADEEEEHTGFTSPADERTRQLREVAVREGQDRFRGEVLEAYGAKCAITTTDVPAVLDAAHIMPYRGPRDSVVQNGLCLRRDIHSLFDRGMLVVDETTYQVQLDPVLVASPTYTNLDGGRLRLPKEKDLRPDPQALRAHRLWAERDPAAS